MGKLSKEYSGKRKQVGLVTLKRDNVKNAKIGDSKQEPEDVGLYA